VLHVRPSVTDPAWAGRLLRATHKPWYISNSSQSVLLKLTAFSYPNKLCTEWDNHCFSHNNPIVVLPEYQMHIRFIDIECDQIFFFRFYDTRSTPTAPPVGPLRTRTAAASTSATLIPKCDEYVMASRWREVRQSTAWQSSPRNPCHVWRVRRIWPRDAVIQTIRGRVVMVSLPIRRSSK